MTAAAALERGLKKFDDSPTKLAAAMGNGVLRQHIEHWLKAGSVPERHAGIFAMVTGQKVWEVRPDDWHTIFPMLVGTKGAPSIPDQETEKARA
jgi:hypothetical protein